MNGRLLLAALCGIVVVACLFAPVEAAIQYRYAFYDQYGASSTTFYVDPGQTVKVYVYLEEYSDDGSSSLLKTKHGLVYAGVKITFQTPGLPGRATVANASDIGLNPDFDDGLTPHEAKTSLTTDTAALWDSQVGMTPYLDGGWVDYPIESDPNKAYLGWFAFTGGAMGVVTGFSAEDPVLGGGNADIVTADGVVLDSLLIADSPTAQGEIVTTPEPATGLIWIGLTSLFALTGRIRRKGSGVCDRS
jgi:hypothetical protein